jgi:hypothetical protein
MTLTKYLPVCLSCAAAAAVTTAATTTATTIRRRRRRRLCPGRSGKLNYVLTACRRHNIYMLNLYIAENIDCEYYRES